MNTLLLGDPSPSLQWRAATELEGIPSDDEDVQAASREIGESAPVRSLLARLEAARGAPHAIGFILCQLAYLGYSGPEITDAVEALFTLQLPNGAWGWSEEDEPDPPSSERC